MNAYEKINLLKQLLPDDEKMIRQAEKTLWDTFMLMRQQATAQDFIRALDGKPQREVKEKPSLAAAKEAHEQLRELGKKAGIDFPALATDAELIEWLARDYIFNVLVSN